MESLVLREIVPLYPHRPCFFFAFGSASGKQGRGGRGGLKSELSKYLNGLSAKQKSKPLVVGAFMSFVGLETVAVAACICISRKGGCAIQRELSEPPTPT
jgi:hypothetical protein